MKFIIFIFFSSVLFSNNKYMEPEFVLLHRNKNIEVRQYSEYVIAKTTITSKQIKSDNNMFRTLASYIFGGNTKNQNIPMTAPVTTFQDDNSYGMLFYMLNSNNIEELPEPKNQNIIIEKFNLGKCVVINFSWFINDRKINKYQNKLKKFLKDNGYIQKSPFMVNRYDPPWKLPFMRRNEVLVQIQ